ncbi:HrpE/YscL family type III secretion apparatus protein [Pokkaliibacter plantistimulans]|uniref:HrpE/YscL family type III secretion apparatus protein n=1 Tax=Pokkaliibacter plantistimulans TaxID=1635171 RepID=UPI000D74B504|nr:HrpE/YscL family type III secretion apparatus protein [Pokkaliibacter plantistimulans]
MFVRRRISLQSAEDLALLPVITARQLQLCTTVEQITARAEQQAALLLEQAELQAESLLGEARAQAAVLAEQARAQAQEEVWQEANGLLQTLQQQRDALWDEVEQVAEQLVQSALQAVLGDMSAELRGQSLVRQLVATQRQAVPAVLRCTTALQPVLEQALQQQRVRHWQLETDPFVADDSVILETDAGVFRCSWSAICEQLNSTLNTHTEDH